MYIQRLDLFCRQNELTAKELVLLGRERRKRLEDLVEDHITQMELDGKIVQEYCYIRLGFVPTDVIRLKKVCFSKLNVEQIKSVEKYLEMKKMFMDRIKF